MLMPRARGAKVSSPDQYGLVCVVIVNWNGWANTFDCVHSLRALAYPRLEIVVVDNASYDNSEAKLRQAFPHITVLQTGVNLGYAGGNNLGIRWALARGADYIWILNNDTIVNPGALTALVDKINSDPQYAMCGSLLVYDHERERVQACGGARFNWATGTARYIGEGISPSRLPAVATVEAELDYVLGASLLVRQSFIETGGLLDERYFLYFEELDWAARLQKGQKLGFAPRSIVYHKDGATIGKNRPNWQMPAQKRFHSEYYLLRARFLFYRKQRPVLIPCVATATILSILWRLVRGQIVRASITARAVGALITGWGRPRLHQEFED
jgi:GT2 family glycosyltransferase